jgi:hypothetical protein
LDDQLFNCAAGQMTTYHTTRTAGDCGPSIPRDWQISNPVPAYEPSFTPPKREFPHSFFSLYRRFVQEILPNFNLSNSVIPSEALSFMKSAFEEPCTSALLYELMMRQYLLACQAIQIGLMSHSTLAKCALLHHDLVVSAELIQKRQLSLNLANLCDMLLAEVVDIYQGIFITTISQNFWAENKTADDVVHHLFKKEFGLLRQLNAYSFKMLGSAMVKRAIETAAPAAVAGLAKWAEDNEIPME